MLPEQSGGKKEKNCLFDAFWSFGAVGLSGRPAKGGALRQRHSDIGSAESSHYTHTQISQLYLDVVTVMKRVDGSKQVVHHNEAQVRSAESAFVTVHAPKVREQRVFVCENVVVVPRKRGDWVRNARNGEGKTEGANMKYRRGGGRAYDGRRSRSCLHSIFGIVLIMNRMSLEKKNIEPLLPGEPITRSDGMFGFCGSVWQSDAK
jgi:hypothetical protein